MSDSIRTICLLLMSGVTLAGCSQATDLLTKRSSKTPAAKQEQKDLIFDVARANEKQGNLKAAKETYLQLVAMTPNDIRLLHRLGVVHARLEEHEQAKVYFETAVGLGSLDSQMLTDYGYNQYLMGEHAFAEDIFRLALKEDRQNERAMSNLALVVGMQGRMDESLALFNRVVSPAEANANIAYIYAQQGDIEGATREYAHALTLDEDLTKASMALVQIAQTRPQMPRDVQIPQEILTAEQMAPAARPNYATPVQQPARTAIIPASMVESSSEFDTQPSEFQNKNNWWNQ